jgi:hypothetical protein
VKAALCLILIFFALLPPTNWARGDSSSAPTDESVTVYYFDFAIERITGIHEDGIAQEGCKYSINQRDFLSILSPTAETKRYQPLDVRAVVIFETHMHFYIDRNGNVRQGQRHYNMDKSEFAKLLKGSAGKCR